MLAKAYVMFASRSRRLEASPVTKVQKFKLGPDQSLGRFKQLTDLRSRNPLCVTDLMNKVKTEGWSSNPPPRTQATWNIVPHFFPLKWTGPVNPQDFKIPTDQSARAEWDKRKLLGGGSAVYQTA